MKLDRPFRTHWLLACAVITSCQTAPKPSFVRELEATSKKGGRLELSAQHSEEDRARADMMMRKTCGDQAVQIKSEGPTAEATSPSSTWQITYECQQSRPSRK